MEKQEKRWVIYFAAAVMLATSLPYLLGYAMQGSDWRFSGFVFGVEDGNSYIAKMLSGSNGAWLFKTPYTAFPQTGALIYLPFLLLGKLVAPPAAHEQFVALFQCFRVIAGFLFILATYNFLSLFIRDVRLRRWGLVLTCLGGGFGWLLILLRQGSLFNSLPLDLYSPETFGFLELYGLPHLALARAGMLAGLALYLQAYLPLSSKTPDDDTSLIASDRSIGRVRSTVLLALIGIGTFLMQPLAAILMWVVIGLHQVILLVIDWRKRVPAPDLLQRLRDRLRQPFLAGLASLPLAIFSAVEILTDPYLKSWASQNVIRSPNPVHYLIAYGLMLPFAIAGALRLLRREAVAGWLPAGWLLAAPFLVYAPVNLQRRLADGVWVVLVLLALYYFDRLKPAEKPRFSYRLFWPASILILPTTLILLSGGVIATLRPGQPVYLPAAEVNAFSALTAKNQPGSVVLASFATSNVLPAWTSVRVLIGHGPESMNLAEIEPQVNAFYLSRTKDSQRIALLDQFQVSYVFWGPAERALGDWDPRQAAFLTPVYQNGDYDIFAYSRVR